MRKFTTFSCFALAILLMPLLLTAQVKFPAIIGDNMVLQQKSNVPLWGWTAPGKMVNVIPEWNKKKVTTLSKPDGSWSLQIETPSAGGPYWIKVNDTVLINILIGEVWFCSGQSNMEWGVKKADSAEREIASANYPEIRYFTVARLYSEEPKKNCYGRWIQSNPVNTENFSAVAYFFGRELHKVLNVPIGLINSSWGGTPAEAWTKNTTLESISDLKVYLDRFRKKCEKAKPAVAPLDQNSPSALFNAMVNPVIPFGIKGAIWYQGESNTPDPTLYETLFPAMITCWRNDWGRGDFPFYYVQIAPYNYEVPDCGAALRDAQRNCLSLKNTGMVVTLDIGNPKDIHPTNKQEVGRRLALWALNKDYGKQEIVYSGPLYKSMTIENSRIRLEFDQISGGLIAKDGLLKDFEIADKEMIYIPASTAVEGNSVVVSAQEIKSPVAVRYAFHNENEASLFNGIGLPASTFRTDRWPINVEKTMIEGRYNPSTGDIEVTMKGENNPREIHYETEGYEPNSHSPIYKEPLHFNKSTKILANGFLGDIPSTSKDSLEIKYHLAVGKKVVFKTLYHEKYSGSGDGTLADGILGGNEYWDGRWLGFYGSSMDATIDLGKVKKIKNISAGFLQRTESYIFFPRNIEIFTSINGTDFIQAGTINPEEDILKQDQTRRDFNLDMQNLKSRYIQVKAKGLKVCPEGHPGEGERAWLFADEIVVQ